jgi:hypothetical protein
LMAPLDKATCQQTLSRGSKRTVTPFATWIESPWRKPPSKRSRQILLPHNTSRSNVRPERFERRARPLNAIAICQPGGTGSSRRSDLIRNSVSAGFAQLLTSTWRVLPCYLLFVIRASEWLATSSSELL